MTYMTYSSLDNGSVFAMPLRLLHVLNLVFFPPMMILGGLLLFGGENPTPRYDQLGIALLVISAPLAIGVVYAANRLWRNDQQRPAYMLSLLPGITWAVLLVLVATQTQFFYQTCC